MADHADDGDNIFVYRGGRAPLHVTRVLIDRSVDVIEENAFEGCKHLVQVETHDGIRRVDEMAFHKCQSLRGIILRSVLQIGEYAFYYCENLADVEFGNKLETIGTGAFNRCSSLKRLVLPSIITIKAGAFRYCSALTDIEFSERLDKIESGAFSGCRRLERIAIPLKRGLLGSMFRYNQFDHCEQLRTVDLVGGIHKTVSSLHMESWTTEMIAKINRINQVLPTAAADEITDEIQACMDSALDKMDQYKAEHYRFVKEGITLLELALWKAKLDEIEDNYSAEGRAKKARIARKEKRITCGADMVIKNILIRGRGRGRWKQISRGMKRSKGKARSATLSNERHAQLVVSRMMKHLTDVHLSKNRQRLG
eukprot:scaffold469_cov138-Skeletonema_dohrnii-CCMP3373.AAC.2